MKLRLRCALQLCRVSSRQNSGFKIALVCFCRTCKVVFTLILLINRMVNCFKKIDEFITNFWTWCLTSNKNPCAVKFGARPFRQLAVSSNTEDVYQTYLTTEPFSEGKGSVRLISSRKVVKKYYIFCLKSSWFELVSTRRSTVLILPLQWEFPDLIFTLGVANITGTFVKTSCTRLIKWQMIVIQWCHCS